MIYFFSAKNLHTLLNEKEIQVKLPITRKNQKQCKMSSEPSLLIKFCLDVLKHLMAWYH
jgi:hypothetical protein